MSTSDRVCPTHGDIGALPSHTHCPQCGAGLVMKSTLRTAGENIVHGAAIGLGVGFGAEIGNNIADSLTEAAQ
jgi:hypothetical protein